MTRLKTLLAVTGLLFIGTWVGTVGMTAHAATKGDPLPAAQNGRILVQTHDGGIGVWDGGGYGLDGGPVDDGGPGSGVLTPVPCFAGQNTMALYNNGLPDAGTGTKTVYCGYSRTTANPTYGFPIPYQGFLGIDLVSNSTTCTKQLYCVGANTNWYEVDLRWMVVK